METEADKERVAEERFGGKLDQGVARMLFDRSNMKAGERFQATVDRINNIKKEKIEIDLDTELNMELENFVKLDTDASTEMDAETEAEARKMETEMSKVTKVKIGGQVVNLERRFAEARKNALKIDNAKNLPTKGHIAQVNECECPRVCTAITDGESAKICNTERCNNLKKQTINQVFFF